MILNCSNLIIYLPTFFILQLFKIVYIIYLDFMKNCKVPQKNYLDGALYKKCIIITTANSTSTANVQYLSSHSANPEEEPKWRHNLLRSIMSQDR